MKCRRPYLIALGLLLLVVVIVLEVFITLRKQESKPRHRIRAPRLRLHGKRIDHRAPGSPRIAILTMIRNLDRSQAENLRSYSQYWGYEVIDVFRASTTVALDLRVNGAQPNFLIPFAILRFLSQFDW